MMRWMIITAMIMLNVLPSAFANVFVSVDCPEDVYAHELFKCNVILYNDSKDDVDLQYAVRFSKGRALPISSNEKGEVNIPAFTKKEIDVNLWASGMGGDVFIFEYGHGKIEKLAGDVMTIVSAPIRINIDSISATAGQKNTVKTEVVGEGYFVKVQVDYPPSIMGTPGFDLGDVEGTRPITIHITPDPYATGERAVDFLISFSDERGNHTLLQRVPINVAPSYHLIGAAVALVALLLALAFFAYKRLKS